MTARVTLPGGIVVTDEERKRLWEFFKHKPKMVQPHQIYCLHRPETIKLFGLLAAAGYGTPKWLVYHMCESDPVATLSLPWDPAAAEKQPLLPREATCDFCEAQLRAANCSFDVALLHMKPVPASFFKKLVLSTPTERTPVMAKKKSGPSHPGRLDIVFGVSSEGYVASENLTDPYFFERGSGKLDMAKVQNAIRANLEVGDAEDADTVDFYRITLDMPVPTLAQPVDVSAPAKAAATKMDAMPRKKPTKKGRRS